MRLLPAILVGVVVAHAPMTPIRPAEVQPAVHEVQITALKFSFAPATIQVVAGEPVRLVIHSADTVHGFAIRELKIDLQIPKDSAPVTVARPTTKLQQLVDHRGLSPQLSLCRAKWVFLSQ